MSKLKKWFSILAIGFVFSNSIAQQPRLVFPTKFNFNLARFSLDDKRIITTTGQTADLWDLQTGTLLRDYNEALKCDIAIISPDGTKVFTLKSNDSIAKIWNAETLSLLTIINLKNHLRKDLFLGEFTPDGKKIMIAGNHTLQFWDAETGKLLTEIRTFIQIFDDYRYRLSFSPDGRKIFICDSSGNGKSEEIKIWDVESGRLLSKFKEDLGAIYHANISFSPDGKKIAIASSLVKVWNTETGTLLATLNVGGHIVFSPSGNEVLIYGTTVTVWNTNTWAELFDISWDPHLSTLVAFSLDGKKIFTREKTIKVWDSETGKLLNEMKDPVRDGTYSILFSHDGKRILTVIPYGFTIWSLETGDIISEIKVHAGGAGSFFSPDGKKLFSVGGAIWSAKTGQILSIRVDSVMSRIAAGISRKISLFTGALTYDRKKLAFRTNDSVISIFDTNTDTLLSNLRAEWAFQNSVVFSLDGKTVLTISNDSPINGSDYIYETRVWEVQSGRLLHKSKFSTVPIISPDGGKIITASFDTGRTYSPTNKGLYSQAQSIKIWDSKNGNLLGNIQDAGLSTYLSPDGRKIITEDGRVWDAVTFKLLANLGHWIREAYFSHDGQKVAVLDSSVDILDTQNFALRTRLKSNFLSFPWGDSDVFSPDGSKIVTIFEGNTEKIWDVKTGKLDAVLTGHHLQIESTSFSRDNKFILTSSSDQTKEWDANSGKLICTFFSVDSNEYFNITPDGYYQGSPEATKLIHYVTNELKVITFDQLDVKYNRPDKVLEALGNTDTALINAYRRAYYKRIQKLNIDTSSFEDGYSVPEADFVNRDKIEYDQFSGKLILRIKGTDSSYNLDRFNIWVNDAPVFSSNGINVLWHNKKSFDTTVTITLSQGKNRIETSVANVNGIESFRIPLFVNYTPRVPKKETIYFVGIGINRFADSSHDLRFCAKDVRDLALKFKERYGSSLQIDTLFDENVTTDKVKAIKQKLLQSSEDDKVIIAYSGHGLLSKDYDYYLSTYNVNFSQPEQDGLPYDELENLVDGIKARKKLMLIDACHSGEIDKEELIKSRQVQSELSDVAAKGVTIVVDSANRRLGIKNSFELMQELFVNVGRGTGTTIISAASGTQFALERGDLRNGVFSYSVMELLKPGQTVTVNELKKHVISRVIELTKGLQQPTTRNEIQNVDWWVW